MNVSCCSKSSRAAASAILTEQRLVIGMCCSLDLFVYIEVSCLFFSRYVICDSEFGFMCMWGFITKFDRLGQCLLEDATITSEAATLMIYSLLLLLY